MQTLYRAIAAVLQTVLSVKSEPFTLSNELGNVIFKKAGIEKELGLIRSTAGRSSVSLPKVEVNASEVIVHVSDNT